MLKKKKRKVATRPKGVIYSGVEQDAKGRHFDLVEIFNKLNWRYFGGKLANYKICWMRRRSQRPIETVVFATIQEEDRVIRVSRHLDQKFVPKWFLQYVIYHEMLHTTVPEEIYGKRRIVHTKEFLELERKSPFYARGHKWEYENVHRFFKR